MQHTEHTWGGHAYQIVVQAGMPTPCVMSNCSLHFSSLLNAGCIIWAVIARWQCAVLIGTLEVCGADRHGCDPHYPVKGVLCCTACMYWQWLNSP